MNTLISLFGEGNHLSVLQMCLRAVAVFLAALVMLRVTGQRTRGQRSAFDSVVMIILGAVLSRAVTGSAPFLQVICASFTIVLFHRLLGWICLFSDKLGKLIKGDHIILFSNGELLKDNMHKTLVTEKDIMEAVHFQVNQNDVENIAQIYMERSGEISVVKKVISH